MVSRHRSHAETDNRSSQSHSCGTISVQTQLRMDRAARRQLQIESGINRGSGSGAHGGSKRQHRRKDRRLGRIEARSLEL